MFRLIRRRHDGRPGRHSGGRDERRFAGRKIHPGLEFPGARWSEVLMRYVNGGLEFRRYTMYVDIWGRWNFRFRGFHSGTLS